VPVRTLEKEEEEEKKKKNMRKQKKKIYKEGRGIKRKRTKD
jgi:hypothetical protein